MALVNKIIPFSCIDGPGNRTAIFFQGCNFKCTYCHNPETINKCVNCGKCVKVCPVNALNIVEKKLFGMIKNVWRVMHVLENAIIYLLQKLRIIQLMNYLKKLNKLVLLFKE